MKLKCWIKCHNRAIQYLAWRPFDFLDDQPADHDEKLLATASNDGSVRVINLVNLFQKDVLEDVEMTQEAIQIFKSDKTFRGHGGFHVLSVAWSHHNPNHLVSVSYDNTAVVSLSLVFKAFLLNCELKYMTYLSCKYKLAIVIGSIDAFKMTNRFGIFQNKREFPDIRVISIVSFPACFIREIRIKCSVHQTSTSWILHCTFGILGIIHTLRNVGNVSKA